MCITPLNDVLSGKNDSCAVQWTSDFLFSFFCSEVVLSFYLFSRSSLSASRKLWLSLQSRVRSALISSNWTYYVSAQCITPLPLSTHQDYVEPTVESSGPRVVHDFIVILMHNTPFWMHVSFGCSCIIWVTSLRIQTKWPWLKSLLSCRKLTPHRYMWYHYTQIRPICIYVIVSIFFKPKTQTLMNNVTLFILLRWLRNYELFKAAN